MAVVIAALTTALAVGVVNCVPEKGNCSHCQLFDSGVGEWCQCLGACAVLERLCVLYVRVYCTLQWYVTVCVCVLDGPAGENCPWCYGEGLNPHCQNFCDQWNLGPSCTCAFPIPGVDAYCGNAGAACQPTSDGKNCVVNFVAYHSEECCASQCGKEAPCCDPGCPGAVQCYVLQ